MNKKSNEEVHVLLPKNTLIMSWAILAINGKIKNNKIIIENLLKRKNELKRTRFINSQFLCIFKHGIPMRK